MRNILLAIVFLISFTIMGCSSENNTENNVTKSIDRTYGKSLNIDIKIQDYENTTLYRPIELTKKTPIVLFVPGWGSKDHNSYKTLLSFIASQGYLVFYSKCDSVYSVQGYIDRYTAVLNDASVTDIVDKDKIGVIGHSSGGGFAFKILHHFSNNGYGDNGRFIFVSDPWFSFEMGNNEFKNIPSNTKLIIQHYAKDTSTDPRIPLTIFKQLNFLDAENIDFQNYASLTHGYPTGSKSPELMQILLKPLDALMENVFLENTSAKKIALDLGSDTPIESYFENILPNHTYPYPCYGDQNLNDVLTKYGINYCTIVE